MRERRTLGVVALLIAVLTALAGVEPPALPAAVLREQAAMVLAGKAVVLDPGHGGPDGGAVGRSGSVEKAITLDVALRLRDLLNQAGAKAVLTREADRDLADAAKAQSLRQRKRQDLAARVALGNESGADVFLSIHANSFPTLPSMHGAQTFYLASGSSENRRLATALQDELVRLTANTDREPRVSVILSGCSMIICKVRSGKYSSNGRSLTTILPLPGMRRTRATDSLRRPVPRY